MRVIDLTTVIFGPLASQVLADWGAEVVKIETPEGDSTRYTGPGLQNGLAAMFLGSNRGKKSVVLDLKQPAARDALLALVSGADVFMHNIRPQKLAALGIEPQALRARCPRLVYASLLGFDPRGPYAGRPAYDDVIQGMSGLTDLARLQGGEPRYLPTIAADKTSALVAAQAIMAALLRRERTGQGASVEVPMFETMVAFNMVEHFYGAHFEPPLSTIGYPRVLTRWRRPWQTSDGHVCMMPYTDAHWRAFFAEVGEPALADDPRFADIASRTRHIAELLALAGAFVAQRSTAQWLEICERLQIPAAPSVRVQDLPDDPQLQATGFFETVQDGDTTLRFPGVPVRFDGVRPPVHRPPRLGEHTREQLAAAGLAGPAIEALLASGGAVVHQDTSPSRD